MGSYKDLKIVIIGDGIAGYTAARQIKRLAAEAPVTLIGAEKVPPYSACALPDYLAGYQGREGVFLPSFLELEGVEIRRGTLAEGIDTGEQRVKVSGQWLPYDRLILATGSVAIIPPVPGAGLPGNFTLKTLKDVDAILAWGGWAAVVVGSGAIGIETSLALREKGFEVTLIELLDRILPTAFDLEPSRLLQAEVEKHGVRVMVGEKVMEVKGQERVTGVGTTGGDIPCDLVIWAAGVRPNITLGREANLEIGQFRGLKVNAALATSAPYIYACGDCVETWDRVLQRPGLSLLWASAKEQAAVAASNCLGIAREYPGSLGVLIEEIGTLTAVSAGFTEASLQNMPGIGAINVLKGKDACGYHKMLVQGEKIVGIQVVGHFRGAGAVLAWMQKGTPLAAIREVLDNPVYLSGAPWYNQAVRLVS
ncbi:MAG: hypothetical protein PWQ18_1163 [Clostridia bacterium]|nr:hypothetical protein [Clostridia bacterium]